MIRPHHLLDLLRDGRRPRPAGRDRPRGRGGGDGPRRDPLAGGAAGARCRRCGRRSSPPALLTFALSFDDFVLSFFTTGEDAAAAAGADLVGDPLRGLADDQRDRDADDGRLADRDRRSPCCCRGCSGAARAALRVLTAGDGSRMSERLARGDPARERDQALRRASPPSTTSTSTIAQGEFFSLLGPVGLRQDDDPADARRLRAARPRARILLEGEPVENVPPYRRNVNTVFQSYALFEHLDVARQRRLRPARQEGRQGRDQATRVAEALELVALARARQARGPASSRAASASASRSPARSSTARRCCCSTSRSARST